MQQQKPKLAIHKFTSCDGCQLAFFNLGEELLELAKITDIVHFAEAGPVNPNTKVDIAFIEGSISTPEEIERINLIRKNSNFLITIGACATAGGIQALKNFADGDEWLADVYAKPKYVSSLKTSDAIAKHVKVDLELWGCPVNSEQVLDAIRQLLYTNKPYIRRDSVCMECKRQNNVCVLVAKGAPCMGPVTQTGCNALCPAANRDCYACYGPDDNPNTDSLSKRFGELGLSTKEIQRRFLFINNQADAFLKAGNKLADKTND